jgi:hypothetical protein
MSYVDQELTVEDMLADPIVQTLMRYDGISASDVRHTIDQVNRVSEISPNPDRVKLVTTAASRSIEDDAA